LLWVLATHPGRVLSREAIMDLLRGKSLEAFDCSIDVHISRLRAGQSHQIFHEINNINELQGKRGVLL
jgi:DNA-binding response OmpR family regulator